MASTVYLSEIFHVESYFFVQMYVMCHIEFEHICVSTN